MSLAAFLREKLPEREIRYSVLGYIQRGGSPTYFTRVLATRFGSEAVRLLAAGKYPFMVGIKGDEILYTPLKRVVTTSRLPNLGNIELINRMAI